MKQRLLGDPEFYLMIEEEKILCEKNIEFIKGILKKGIGEKNGKLVDKDIFSPSIKLDRKLNHKEELYQVTETKSQWKLITDVKGLKKLIAFLEIKFPKTNLPELHFCFEMDLKLYKTGEEKIVKIENKEYKAKAYQFEKNTDTLLQWMKLLIDTKGINIVDGEDPSVGIEGIPIDVPVAILRFFDDIISMRHKEKEHVIILRTKGSLKEDYI